MKKGYSSVKKVGALKSSHLGLSNRLSRKIIPDYWHYWIMLFPGIILLLIFNYAPLMGSVIAFQKFYPAKGFLKSAWVGFANFKYMFQISDSWLIFRNTLVIAILKLSFMMIVSLAFAIFLNEIRIRIVKAGIQTVVYLPHFFSWVILAGMVRNIFALEGPANSFLGIFGIKSLYWLGDNAVFRWLLIGTEVWKEFGFSAIIFLAALTAISPVLYESAEVDGANRWQKIFHITIPGMMTVIVLVLSLNLGSILNAGFDQIFNLYSPLVYQTSDIIDTYVYRLGLLQAQYSLATAVGLMKSTISFILISLSYWLAYRFANYRIF